jgi:hypothetical protein
LTRWSPFILIAVACGSSAPPAHVVETHQQATQTVSPSPSSRVDVPVATHGMPRITGVPVVSVIDGKVLVDDVAVGDEKPILEKLERVDGLFDALVARRKAWKAAHEGEPLPGVVELAFDAHAKSTVVRSVFQTAGYAAYPNELLVVRAPDGSRKSLPVDAIIPRPGAPPPVPEGLVIYAYVSAAPTLAWKKDRNIVAEVKFASVADLAARIEKEWRANASHVDPSDPMLDRAIVVAPDDVDYAAIVAVIDALAGATRDQLFKGKVERVPALSVSLAVGN